MSDFTHVVCPECAGINRLPRHRLDDHPRCGGCHEPLFQARPIALSASGLDRHLSRSDLPLVVDFWAPWCAPCKLMAPAFEDAAAELEPLVRLAKVDTEAEPGAGARFVVRSIPTLIIFQRGRELARRSGAMSAADIVNWVRASV